MPQTDPLPEWAQRLDSACLACCDWKPGAVLGCRNQGCGLWPTRRGDPPPTANTANRSRR